MAGQEDGLLEDFAHRTYAKIIDGRPLPSDFPFDFMFESYLWRAIFMTSFTLGVRLGGIDAIENLLLSLLPSFLLFVLVYAVFPLSCYYMHKRFGPAYSKMDRRVLLTIVAFLFGIGSGAYNGKYYLEDGPPTYFMPGMVGLSFQLLGPYLARLRRELVAASIGTALIVGIALNSLAGVFTVSALVSLIVAALVASANLQIIIATILDGQADMTEAHIIALCTNVYMHLVFSHLLGQYETIPHQKTRLSLRKAMLN